MTNPTDELIQRAEALAEEKIAGAVETIRDALVHVHSRDEGAYRDAALALSVLSSSGRELVPELVRALKEERAEVERLKFDLDSCRNSLNQETAGDYVMQALLDPPAPSDMLKALMTKPAPWNETEQPTADVASADADDSWSGRLARCKRELSSANRRNSETIEALKKAGQHINSLRDEYSERDTTKDEYPDYIRAALLSNPAVAQETKE